MYKKIKVDRLNLSVLGILIRVARLNQGYSLRNLSKLTNISHTLISNIEKGKQPPSEATLADIFNVLDLKLYTSREIEKEMTEYYNNIFTDIINHHYKEAHVLISKMEKKGHIYENSFEVVNYLIIRCLFYSITDTALEDINDILKQYEKVLEFFTPGQKQLFYFVKGLNHLNTDNYKQASDNFEKALTLGNKDLDVIIKEYLVKAYINQYKFTDGVSIAQSAVEEFEEKTIYVRAMKCRVLIAKVYLKILKLDKAEKLAIYVESFAKQFGINVLTDECHVLKAGIFFLNKEYKEAVKELELHSDPGSKNLVFPLFRAYLMSKDEKLLDYYNDIMTNRKEDITINKYLLIKVLMMWVKKEIRDDKEYIESLNKLAELAIEVNDQEIIGLTHNLLIIFYREKRKYKKALEITDNLLRHKKIHISFYAIKNET